MIEHWQDALTALAAAVGGWRTLGPDHPAVRAHSDRAARGFLAISRGAPGSEAVVADDQVLVGPTLLDLPMPVRRQLAAVLEGAGASALRVGPELSARGTHALIERLATGASASPILGFDLRRLGPGSATTGGLRESPAPPTSAGPQPRTSPEAERLAELARVLRAVHADTQSIERVIEGLADRTLSVLRSGGPALLPLAALKRHDEYTLVHSINVGLLASALAQAAGLGGDRLRHLTLAALLHDVGKGVIPLTFLNKPGRLSDHERAVMQQHAPAGAAILAARPDIPDIASIVAFEHHANLDGTGYPSRPAGWRISLGSQIVHIADVFDALRTHRPYRAALATADCLDLMAREAGAHYDAALFEVFARHIADRAPPIDRAAAA